MSAHALPLRRVLDVAVGTQGGPVVLVVGVLLVVAVSAVTVVHFAYGRGDQDDS